MEQPTTQTSPTIHLAVGEFAPVYWEPLGKRGERLVIGVLVSDPNGICRAYPTLHQKQLLQYLDASKTDSAVGVMEFTFNHFNKTLEAGGTIQDLKAPFARMSIGRTEAISARSDEELVKRAISLCTLLGKATPPETITNSGNTSTRTRRFIIDVRMAVRLVNPGLARRALRSNMTYPIGGSEIKLHFHSGSLYAQFCSLPMPTARPELATECQARLTELLVIKQSDPKAQVALWMNTITKHVESKSTKNATEVIYQRTKAIAESFKIPVEEYESPSQVATLITQL